MEQNIGNYIAGGGVSGAVVCVFYFIYKCCYRKKLHSKCCGNELDIKQDNGGTSPSNRDLQIDVKV